MGVLKGLWRKVRARLPAGPEAAEVFWSEAFEAGGITTWLAEPDIRRYVNGLVSGSGDMWPMDWFHSRYGDDFGHGLSVGCGDGALERDVLSKHICRAMLAVDLSRTALERARQLARQAAIEGVTYRREDFNRFKLPAGAFDIVFFHQSMHHVAELEHCLAQVRRSLTTHGLLYVDEYIGPSRCEWDRQRLAAADRVFAGLPRKFRRTDRVPRPIERRDPSEAVRSSEIVTQIRKRFDIVERRDYGGNILALVYPLLRWDRLEENRRRELLQFLIEADRHELECGAGSYYALIIARKPG